MEEQKIIYIDVNKLIPNRYQPRKIFNENTLQELGLSIQKYGIINPIIVREIDNQYEIIAGERRWRAARKVNLEKVPVIIKNIDDSKMAEIALIENLERENLTPIEEAKAISDIMTLSKLTQLDVGKILGKSQSAIANKLRLLNLPEVVQDAINKKQISERHARALLSVESKDRQIELLNMIIRNKMTVKNLEEIIKEEKINIKYNISNIMNNINKEKESDKMNQGNFFPNYNPQQNNMNNNMNTNINSNMNNNNLSLNALNNQAAMNNSQQYKQNSPEVSVEMPSLNPPINTNSSQQMNTNLNQNPQIADIPPLYNLTPEQNTTNFMDNLGNVNSPVNQNNNQPINQMENSQQIVQQSNKPEKLKEYNVGNNNKSFEQSPMFPDAPIFSLNENKQESHINSEQIIDKSKAEQKIESSNIEKTQKFLDKEGINYKVYANDKSTCIIIEIEKEQN